MRFGIFTTFMVAVLLLAGSFSVMLALPNVTDFGFTMNAAAAPPFSGGNGTSGNPFQITNVSQLQNMSANLSAHYILINDINALETKTWTPGGFDPVGDYSNRFTGTFDGKGYEINELYINLPNNYLGLFGYSNTGAFISNVSLKNAFIKGIDSVGGLVGYGKCDFLNCHVNGTVETSLDYVGGIVGGLNGGTIENCSVTGTIIGHQDYQGGLVGDFGNSIINNSFFEGTVDGRTEVGGIVGTMFAGTLSLINNSYSKGFVIGEDSIGGIAGAQSGNSEIRNCYSTCRIISVDNNVGGLVGFNSAKIKDCYATGDVTGVDRVGGLVGYNWNSGIINNSYSAGKVTGTSNYGGLVGSNNAGTNENSFWDNMTSGQSSSAGGIGKNTTEMMIVATFTGVFWDFTNVWGIIEDNYYPFLLVFYNPPRLITQDIGSAIEDTLYSKGLEAYYADFLPANDIIWSFKTNTGNWLSIDSNGVLSGTPTNDDVGTPWVNVTVTDLVGKFDSYNFTLPISNVNDPPTINTTNVETATEDVLYYVHYEAEDIDPTSDVLIWNLSTNADWLVFNSSSGNLSGTPENADVGSYWLKIIVNDGNGGIDSTEFLLEVENVNDDPMITTTQVPIKVKEEKLYIVSFFAIDEDPTNDIITWDIDKDASWLAFNASTGVLFGAPENEDVGVYDINISVTDGNGGLDWFNYDLTVINVNDPPMIITTDLTNAKVGELYTNQYIATDIDLPGDTLTWSISTNASAWLGFNTSLGLLNGTPGDDQDGSYWVNVMVTDGNGGTDSHNFTLVVKPKPGIPPVDNKDPEITTKDVESAEVDKKYSVVYEATDDRTKVIDLIWTADTNASWLDFNATTKTLSGTPTDSDIGSYWVEIAVADGEGGADVHNFTVTVPKPFVPKPEPKNNPPTITQITEEQKVKAGEKFSIKVTGADQDESDVITFTLQDKPAGMVISKDGEILWIPQDNQVGTHTVVVALSDGKNTTTMSFDVIVEEGKKVEPEEPEKEKVKEFGLEEGIPYLIILLIVGLIIGLLVGMAMARKKKPTEEIKQEEELEETENEAETEEEEELEDEELEDEELEDEVSENEVPEDEVSEKDLEDDELEDEELEDEDLDEDELEE